MTASQKTLVKLIREVEHRVKGSVGRALVVIKRNVGNLEQTRREGAIGTPPRSQVNLLSLEVSKGVLPHRAKRRALPRLRVGRTREKKKKEFQARLVGLWSSPQSRASMKT